MSKYLGNFKIVATVCISYSLLALYKIAFYKFGHVSTVRKALVRRKNDDAHE